MSTVEWVGTGRAHDWEDPLNWNGTAATANIGPVPIDDVDDVIIAARANEPIITGKSHSVKSLTVNVGASITNVGDATGSNVFTISSPSVTNDGTITHSDGSSGVSGVRMDSPAATVTNTGTIRGDAQAAGVFLLAGGVVTNSTSGVITGGVDGILSFGVAANSATPATPATVTNNGTIQGSIGVEFSDTSGVVNNTLTNGGTIIGNTTAVRFGAGDDLLTLLPGSSFTGLVDGGAGTNTLELAGTVAGSLTGLGTSFVNFETLLVDAGAQWTVAGSHGDLGGIAISGLTALDTIDLTDLAFGQISWTFANNTLVLTSATARDTLHIQGNFSAGDFHLSSDGAGGTDIVVVPPAAPITPVAAPPVSPLTVFDTTTNKFIAATGENYSGPVAGLQHEYIINTSPDNLNVTASTPNWFIHTGSGEDAIAVSSGTNVLDGGTGSNFLTGGSGTDTFFVDDRLPPANIWSTVVGFHSGDDATIFGVTPSDFHLTWFDNQGAAGAQGLTAGFTASGQPTANITLAGYSTADLGTKLSVIFGKTADTTGLPGSVYMNIHGI